MIYGLIYLPSSDSENRNQCLHVALIDWGWGRVLKGILDRGVPPWPSNPDLVQEKNPSFCYHVYDIRLTIMILIHFFLHTELSNFLD